MDAWVYVIRSDSTGRYYCGQSTDVERRVRQHNDPNYSLSKTTKRFEGPWKLLWSQACENRGEAMKLEMGKRFPDRAPVISSTPIVVPMRFVEISPAKLPHSRSETKKPLRLVGDRAE
jgi:putative endonuclease